MKTQKDLKIFGVIIIALLGIGAFADLSISHVLYNPTSIFGNVFEIVGELPSTFIATLCALIIAVSQTKINWKSIGSGILAILFSLMAGIMLIAYWDGPNVLALILALIILGINYFLAKSICKAGNPKAYQAAKLGLQLFLIVIVTFNLIKLGWGRERYRHMIEIGSFEGFSAWFIPQGLASGNEFMSFPSGHSANSSIILWITLLPAFIPSLATKENLLKIVAGIWIACVMVSRIVMGAHFLSDVTVGMSITLIVFYLLYRRLFREE